MRHRGGYVVRALHETIVPSNQYAARGLYINGVSPTTSLCSAADVKSTHYPNMLLIASSPSSFLFLLLVLSHFVYGLPILPSRLMLSINHPLSIISADHTTFGSVRSHNSSGEKATSHASIPDISRAPTNDTEEIVQCRHNKYHSKADLTPQAIKAAIDSYCSRSLTLDPNHNSNNQFRQDTSFGQSYDNVIIENVVVRVKAEFDSQNQQNCKPSRSFDTQGDECRRRMEAIQEKCGKDGGMLSSNTQDGCVVWSMWGTSTGRPVEILEIPIRWLSLDARVSFELADAMRAVRRA